MKLIASCIPAFCICFLLAGCVGEEYTYVDDRDLKPGPGLLSGEDGALTIYGKTPPQSESGAQKAEDTKQN